jgi:hypothetical protein
MRIEPSGKSNPVGSAAPAQPDAPARHPAPAGADRVELSALSQAAGGLAPGRLEQIHVEVSAGKYQPDAADVSRHIVDFYLIPLK